ncbi:hypothetical protein EYF80_058591 [Liparis tanakae]|uniref:Uncharacterized protein n=1 Tax=Liparis tanakae TaxID=230148 RepID=A0A4Z2ESB8_9TELE|nr:hypothetical protein EYF80_058591 [Liparis tanakae]
MEQQHSSRATEPAPRTIQDPYQTLGPLSSRLANPDAVSTAKNRAAKPSPYKLPDPSAHRPVGRSLSCGAHSGKVTLGHVERAGDL